MVNDDRHEKCPKVGRFWKGLLVWHIWDHLLTSMLKPISIKLNNAYKFMLDCTSSTQLTKFSLGG